MDREAVLTTVKNPPPDGDFISDGKDEDKRPLTREKMQSGIEAYHKSRGRPTESGSKEQVATRLDRDVLAAFRATGPGCKPA